MFKSTAFFNKILLAVYFLIILSILIPAGSQTPADFPTRVKQSIQNNNTENLTGLIQSDRSEAIRLIEALLDSSIVKSARKNTTGAYNDKQMAKKIADIYTQIFNDEYYQNRVKSYTQFTGTALEKKSEIIHLKQRGKSEFYGGNFLNALSIFERAYNLAQEIDDTDEIAALTGSIGSAYFYLGEFDKALDYYKRSLMMHEKLGDKRRIGNRLGNIATVYSDKSDYPMALEYYEKAIKIRKEIEDLRGLAADLNNSGLVYEEMGEYIRAFSQYDSSYVINKSINNIRSTGKNLANMANVYLNLGDFSKAISIYEETITIRRETGDEKGLGNDLGNLGIVYMNLGDFNKAHLYFNKALEIHKILGYKEGEAYQLARIAKVCSYKGDYTKAIINYQKALALHKEIGHMRGVAYWLEALGEVYTGIGDYNNALSCLEKSLTIQKQSGNKNGVAVAQLEMSQIYLTRGDIKKAKNHVINSLQIFSESGEKRNECLTLIRLGNIYDQMQDSSKTINCWFEARNIAEEIGEKRFQAWLLQLLGDFYCDHFEPQRASGVYEQGLAIIDEFDDLDLKWQLYYGNGKLWEQQGENDRAITSYKAAIDAIERIRNKSYMDEIKSGVLSKRYKPYEAIISLLIQMGKYEEALEYVEHTRSRNLLDIIGNNKINKTNKNASLLNKEHELRTRITNLKDRIYGNNKFQNLETRDNAKRIFISELHKTQQKYRQTLFDLKLSDPEHAALVNIEPLAATKIKQLLDEDTALLEYFLTENELIIFVLTRDDVQVLRRPIAEKSLYGKIILFRGTATRYMNGQKMTNLHWLKPLNDLYNILISPVEKSGHLANKKRLIFIPQGILYHLPFQALISEYELENNVLQNVRYLVQDYIISYAPSASILKYCKEKKSELIRSLLLLAPKCSSLPMTKNEILEIKNIYGDIANCKLDENATESLVRENGKEYDLIHFATTAHFNRFNPIFSSLDLARSGSDDGQLEVHEIFDLDLTARLVTLSACQTAIGSGFFSSFPQGDDFVSLSSAFLYAGSPCVIASLWEIHDRSTSLFMNRFYRHLKTERKAEALALTQREMLNNEIIDNQANTNMKFTHPYFWASFVLIGS